KEDIFAFLSVSNNIQLIKCCPMQDFHPLITNKIIRAMMETSIFLLLRGYEVIMSCTTNAQVEQDLVISCVNVKQLHEKKSFS
ncbi:MAG: hypothetical protein LBE13_19795, partial [Bacteroidales bacterium]|nr:hypothetical protein [Bacteroidales bacterium]